MASSIDLSVIIVSYNNRSVLVDCLDSIERFNDLGDALQVIVVEQSPEDDLFVFLSESYRNVDVVRNDNRGFGAGNNRGFLEAKGRYLLFLNPDTVIQEPVFAMAVAIFDADDKLGLFGGRLLDAGGQRNQSFYFRNPIGLFRGYVWRALDRLDLFIPGLMYITGADLFVRAEAFVAAGRFDERMFMYFEEPDLCNRVEAQGYRIAYFPEIRIVHLEGKSGIESEKSFGFKLDSLAVYCDKNGVDYLTMLHRWSRILTFKRMLRNDDRNSLHQMQLISGRMLRVGKEQK